MEQTKGYLRLKGEVYNLEKETYENSSSRTQTLIIKTSDKNRVKINLGKWKNSSLNVKMKCEGMDKAIDINEQEAIEEIKASFNEGDTVFVNCRMDVNTYKEGSLDFQLSNIYISENKIDFAATDFEEVSELKTDVVITEKIKDGIQKVALVTYKGDKLIRNLIVKDQDIAAYLKDEVNVGDVLNVFINIGFEPVYGEKEESKTDESARKTFKNRNVGGTNSKGKIIGNKEVFVITDIDVEKNQKGKYTVEELGLETQSNDDMPF